MNLIGCYKVGTLHSHCLYKPLLPSQSFAPHSHTQTSENRSVNLRHGGSCDLAPHRRRTRRIHRSESIDDMHDDGFERSSMSALPD